MQCPHSPATVCFAGRIPKGLWIGEKQGSGSNFGVEARNEVSAAGRLAGDGRRKADRTQQSGPGAAERTGRSRADRTQQSGPANQTQERTASVVLVGKVPDWGSAEDRGPAPEKSACGPAQTLPTGACNVDPVTWTADSENRHGRPRSLGTVFRWLQAPPGFLDGRSYSRCRFGPGGGS